MSTMEAFLSNLELFEALLDGTAYNSDWEKLNKITVGKAEKCLPKSRLHNGKRLPIKEYWNKYHKGKYEYLATLAYRVLRIESHQCYYCYQRSDLMGADVSFFAH